jgi:TP901 family phage tail tape measure protein
MSKEIGGIHGSIVIDDQGSAKVKDFAGNLTKVTDVAKGVVLGLTGFGGLSWALGQVKAQVVDSVQGFATFEDMMARNATLIDDSASNVRNLESGVRDLAEAYGMSAGGLAAGLNQVLQSGVEAGDSLSFLETAIKGNMTGAGSLSEIIEILDNTMDAFNMTAKDAPAVLDKFFAASKAGEIPVNGLTQALSRLAPLASEVGLSLDETLAVLTSLTKQGVKAEDATMSLRLLLAQLADSSSNLNKALGIDGVRSAGDFTAALDKIKKAVGGRTDNAIALFGDSARGLTGILKLANSGAEDFAKGLDAINNAAGESDRRLAKVKDTTAQMMREAKSSWDDFKLDIGEFMAREWLRLQALIAYTTGNTKLYSRLAAVVGNEGEIGGTNAGYVKKVAGMGSEELFAERSTLESSLMGGKGGASQDYDKIIEKLKLVDAALMEVEKSELSTSKAEQDRVALRKENAEWWAKQNDNEKKDKLLSAAEQKEQLAREKEMFEQEEAANKEYQGKMLDDAKATLDFKKAAGEKTLDLNKRIRLAEKEAIVESHQIQSEQLLSMAEDESRSIEERRGAYERYGYEKRRFLMAERDLKLQTLDEEYNAEIRTMQAAGQMDAKRLEILQKIKAMAEGKVIKTYNSQVSSMSISFDMSQNFQTNIERLEIVVNHFSGTVSSLMDAIREWDQGGRFGKSNEGLSGAYTGASVVEGSTQNSTSIWGQVINTFASSFKTGMDIGSLFAKWRDSAENAAIESDKHWRSVAASSKEAADNITEASSEWVKSLGLGDTSRMSRAEISGQMQTVQARQASDISASIGMNMPGNYVATIQQNGEQWLEDLIMGKVEPRNEMEQGLKNMILDKWGVKRGRAWEALNQGQQTGIFQDLENISFALFNGPLASRYRLLENAAANYNIDTIPTPDSALSWEDAKDALGLQRTLRDMSDNDYNAELWRLAQKWQYQIGPSEWAVLKKNAATPSVGTSTTANGIPVLAEGGLTYGPSLAGEGSQELVLPLSNMARTNQLLNEHLGMSIGGSEQVNYSIALKIDPNIPFNQESTRRLAGSLADLLITSRSARGRRS